MVSINKNHAPGMQERKMRGGRRETKLECRKERKGRGVAREKGEEEDDRYQKLNATKSSGVFKMELGVSYSQETDVYRRRLSY